MSAATLSAPALAADATAAAQRVQQLQALIAQARQGGSTASFAAALDAASAGEAGAGPSAGEAGAGQIPAAEPAAAVGAPDVPVSPAGYAMSAGSQSAAGAVTPPAGSSASTPYDATIAQAAAHYNIDPAILHGLIQQESGFDPGARSSAGALGLTQLMPGTASSLGVANPLDPTQSIEGGARYLSQMLSRFGGNTEEALAAYNAGPGAVSRYGGVPPYAETREYVNKVLGYANAYRQQSLAAGAGTSAASATGPLA
jgi:soluble lytic murein transglycosylase-like protein